MRELRFAPSHNFSKPFFTAISLLREPLETFLREVHPRPSCMITDFCNWWTSEAARELKLPRFIFHGPCCFFILSSHNIYRHRAYDGVEDEFEPVVVPGLPQRIEVSRAQAPGWFAGWEEMQERVYRAEETAAGAVINTFHELEADYVELYAEATGKAVLPVGPLSLCNKDAASRAARGKASSVDEDEVSRWLDGMEPGSVLFVSFGSLVRTQPLQVIEIGRGLESSGRPFIWVIKEAERRCPEVEEWLSEGFEERTGARGMIVTGWAPQMVILSHPAVGGFVTHCGWNSMLESVSSGVPMITWPSFWTSSSTRSWWWKF
ncbi:UDP-glycosyltransferase 73C6-like [Iris pallida]|uniref:UDP-glycosyltransferase 73C6-like n=1 Tax=Iris pallida TaxID=29817 RepID=A0AAX6E2R5_IRIPA|nr:UDP-glycosyltransferase 73C6-like [Iris pallida]